MLSFLTVASAGRRLAGVAALLILAVIAVDLGDAGCDPIPVGLGDARVEAAHDEPADDCADLCLPDCFCCATTVAAAGRTITLRPQPAPGVPQQDSAPAAPGFSPLVEHVPLDLT